jgi:hypothetical protein
LTETLQLEVPTIIQLHAAPKLLVEWSSPWQEFVTSIRPAFGRSGARLAGEAPHGMFPYRGMLAWWLLQAFLVLVAVVIPQQINRLRPYAPRKLKPYEVIYYSGDELPRTEDLGGAQAGASGRSGGQQAHHRTQTIHVARGRSLAPQVVDAPNLRLPSSTGAVANLLAFKSIPGPPPAEGLHTSLTAPRLPANVIAPAPVVATRDVTRDQSRGPLTLDYVVPPAPSISGKSRTAPALNAAVVPPVPGVHSEHTLIAPRLDPGIIAPAPNVSREHTLAAPSLSPNVISPASTRVSRDQERSAPALTSSVIPPAPAAAGRQVSPSRVQMNNPAVVPPPVSAPERDTSRNAKLSLPAPSVIAPPPSADSARDLRRLESGSADPSRTVIPPPPTSAAGGSFVSNIIGKLFGTQDVVPPPPTVASGNASGTIRNPAAGSGNTLANNIVPPPPAVASGIARNAAGGPSGSLATNVVPPPPSVGGFGRKAGGSPSGRSQTPALGASNVIPPPPSVTGSGTTHGLTTGTGNSAGSGNGALLAGNVVPPPPSIGSGPGPSGSGRKGSGLGGPGDVGSVLAPPKAEGSDAGSGIVISSQPGSKVGIPGTGGKGSLAMSPSGGDKPGLGGSGGGTSIGHGNGPGSGLNRETPGAASGAGKSGTGLGTDNNTRGGISPTPGPGGAGGSPTGSPAVPGVDVRGGSTNVVTLPSFGSEGSSDPSLPGRSPVKPKQGPSITIVATSRSGGAFDFYGKLPGDNYTVYVDTNIGTVVMQYAEADPSAVHAHSGAPIGPQGLRTDLPADLPHARVVIKCKLDTSGNLKNLQVLEPGPAAMTAKIMAALPTWKFRPALRGQQPVEVNAILGFNIDTNDRY